MNIYQYTILRENVTTFEEKHELEALTESESREVSNQMTINMLKGIGRKKVDFGSIPESKGRIEKFVGYENMQKSIDFLQALSSNNRVEELETVATAVKNILYLGDIFNKGFKLDNPFVKLTYNTLVYASIDIISFLIQNVEIVDNVNTLKGTLRFSNNNKSVHDKCLISLKRFNEECRDNKMRSALEAALGSGRNNFTGAAAGMVGLVLAISSSIIPIIRESIYLFYSMRIKVSDYLMQQAKFVELGAENLEQNNADRNVVMKQRKRVNELMTLSNKLAVNYTIANKKADDELKSENKGWTLKTVRDEAANTDQGSGFQLI